MDAAFQGSSAWTSATRIGRVDRVERVEASSRIQPTSPVRHSGRELGELPRPDPQTLSPGDVQWFQSLVMDARVDGSPSRVALSASDAGLGASGASLVDSPAERIVHGLAHLRTLRGL